MDALHRRKLTNKQRAKKKKKVKKQVAFPSLTQQGLEAKHALQQAAE